MLEYMSQFFSLKRKEFMAAYIILSKHFSLQYNLEQQKRLKQATAVVLT